MHSQSWVHKVRFLSKSGQITRAANSTRHSRAQERKATEPTESAHEYYDYVEMENYTIATCDVSDLARTLTFIPVLYMLIFILGLFGNSVVIFTVWRVRRKWRAANVYIGNLALANLAFMVPLLVWAALEAMEGHWPFGVLMCKIISYVDLLSMHASAFLLTCISFDRYLAIVHSLSSSHLRTRCHVRASLAAVWTLSGLLSAPALVFRTTRHDPSSSVTFCTLDFSLVATSEQQVTLWFAGLSLSLSVLGFLLPLLAMMVFYGLISYTVMRHFSIWRKEDQRKWRLLKILTTVVVVFAICWIPYHVVRSADILSILGLSTCAFDRFIFRAFPYASILAYVNTCLNPFLYAFFDLRFRSQCLGLLQLKKCRQTPTKV
ncbi:apelin receptor B-like [Vanacampus margaritifer]